MLADQDRPKATTVRAKVVRIGNSLGVRLPASLHLQLGSEIELTVQQVDAWPEGYADLEPVGADFQVPARESGQDQEKRIRRLFGSGGHSRCTCSIRISASIGSGGRIMRERPSRR